MNAKVVPIIQNNLSDDDIEKLKQAIEFISSLSAFMMVSMTSKPSSMLLEQGLSSLVDMSRSAQAIAERLI